MRSASTYEAADEEARLRQGAGRKAEDLRQRDPFDLPGPGRAFVILDHGVEQGGHLLAHHRDAGVNIGARDRIALLRHRAATSHGPAAKGSKTSSTSVCIISFTSVEILPSVPVTRPRKQPTSAMRSRMVCQAISGCPRSSSLISAACTSSPSVPSEDEVAGGAAELADQHARTQLPQAARDGAGSQQAAPRPCSRR